MFQLPHPQKIAEINSLIADQIKNHASFFSWDRYLVENRVIGELSKFGYGTKRIEPTKILEEPALFDAYSIYRAYNQLNEAGNKLWATMELANVGSPSIWGKTYLPLGDQFKGDFLGGALIPTLYYSQLSAIISILSSFGCISVCDDEIHASYNLVRSKEGWSICERGEYLQKVFGRKMKGWHLQIIYLANGFSLEIPEFPKIDIERTDDLRRLRNTTDYEILASVGSRAVMRVNEYFNFLPLVVDTLKKGSSILGQICGQDMKRKRPLSSLEERTKNLLSNLSKLYSSYGKQLPKA